LNTMTLTRVKLGAAFLSLTSVAITGAAVIAAAQGNADRKPRMSPERRALTKHMIESGKTYRGPGKIGSGMSCAELRPTLVALLKEHGSAKVTTLDGVEVSVRLYEEREIDAAEALLKQVLLEGPVDIRGPADPTPDPEATSEWLEQVNNTKQKARKLLSSARREIVAGDLENAAKLLAEASALDSKWGLFDDTPEKVGEALRRARGH
jgi:hypothetical protein